MLQEKLQAEATLGERYQVVIPKKIREKVNAIKRNAKIVITPINSWSLNMTVKPNPLEWARATRGITKGTWGGASKIDKYVKDLRRQWERRILRSYSKK